MAAFVARVLGFGSTPIIIDIPSVEIHSVETDSERRARCVKHLLKANHINHAVLYRNLQCTNQTAHVLSAAYLLGATVQQLHDVYDDADKQMEPWTESPSEVIDEDWRDLLGEREYQRGFLDFFEDRLVMRYAYDWKSLVQRYLFTGDKPLAHGLIDGLGHPLIHLGYAFEMDSKEIATEALTLSATQYGSLHQYLDDPAFTTPSPFSSGSVPELLQRLRGDARFDGFFSSPGQANIDQLFERHAHLVLEYWNAWVIDDPVKQFEQSQEAAVALLVASVAPGTHSYNLSLVHILTTSHAVRVLLPFTPAKFHLALVRQWWLLTLAIFISLLRPMVDEDYIDPSTLKGKHWKYVEDKAVNSPWAKDAHFAKAVRAMREAARTWGDVHDRYLAAAVRFVDDFNGWVH